MLSNRLPLLITLLLAAVIAGGLTMQLLPIYHAEQNQTTSGKLAPKSLKQEALTETRSHNIAAFKLFGDMNKVIAKPAPITKDLPKTNLKLKLTGVMASTASSEASALIEGPDKKTQNYRIDDELPGGASLKQVYADRVVIERSGRLENLVFVETRPIGIESYTHPNDIEDEKAADNITPASLPAVTSQASNPARNRSIKDRLSKLRKRMLQNRPAP